MTSLRTRNAAACLLAIFALLAASCSSDDAESSNPKDEKVEAAPTEDEDRAERIAQSIAGTNTEPPAEAPEIDSDKNVWVFSCFELVESCAKPAAATVEAAESLGWDVTLFDVLGQPAEASKGVRNAIADGADAIIGGATDCRLAPAAFEEAKAAGVLVVTYYAFDCDDDDNVDADPVFDGEVIYGDGSIANYTEFNTKIAAAKADWVIEQTDKNAKIITVDQTEVTISKKLIDGIRAGIQTCAECEIVDIVEVTTADVASGGIESKLAQSLAQHPEANTVFFGIDFHATLGGANAIQASGRDMVVIGAEGYETAMSLMQEGTALDAVGAISGAWGGYAAVDALVRLFAGEEILPSGIGWQIIEAQDAQDGDYEPDFDFRSHYKEIWGVS